MPISAKDKAELDFMSKLLAGNSQPTPEDVASARATAVAAVRGGGQVSSGQITQKIPTKGEVRGGYRFKGGSPNDKANWEKI